MIMCIDGEDILVSKKLKKRIMCVKDFEAYLKIVHDQKGMAFIK